MIDKITNEITKKISNLSRIELSSEENKKITESFGPILEMIDEVNTVDLGENIQRNFSLKNIMREDTFVEKASENKKEIIENFPDTKDNYLKTKKILG